MTGRRRLLDALSEGACKQLPSQLCLVSLHAGSGLCRSGLLRSALGRAVSFLISARRVDSAVHETQDSPPLRVSCCCCCFTERNIHRYLVKECAGFLWVCCYSFAGSKLPKGCIFPEANHKSTVVLCFCYFIFWVCEIFMPP